MRKITQTIVGTTPPTDKNVLWLDTTNSNSPVEKVFLNGAWIPTSAAGGDYYTKDEVDENFMGKIDAPNVGNILVMDENGKAVDSTKKVADFIANPEVSGQNGEVLSIDSEGNPIWTTITPTGTADDEMSNTSTNAVQNKVIKEYIDNNYARKDGYYSQMTVGIAKNLAGENAVEAEYTYRQSGGTIGTDTGIANVTDVKGKTLVMNQLISHNTPSGTKTDITFTNNGNGSWTVNGTAAANRLMNLSSDTFTQISGHKYLVSISPTSLDVDFVANGIAGFGSTTSKSIIVCSVTGTQTMALRVLSGATVSNIMVWPQIINLTLMFGAGNEPSTVEEFEALYTLDYYAYNAGALVNNNASAIETTGFNQWDEQIEMNKYIEPTTGNITTQYSGRRASETYYRCTPNAYYYVGRFFNGILSNVSYQQNIYFYKLDKTFISSNVEGGLVQAPSSAYYFRVASAISSGNICINFSDPAKNGTYEPYEKHTFYFDKVLQGEGSLATIKGKLNGEGESVVVFPDGLKSAGSVCDEIKGNVAIKRIGSVDLGSLLWNNSTDGGQNIMYSAIGTMRAQPDSLTLLPNIICSIFEIKPSNVYMNTLNSITANSLKRIYVRTTETNKTTFKTAMSGVILYYELDTPETYILDQTVTGGYQVNALGTEQRLPEDTASAVNAPVSYSVIYPIDAVGTITKLPINYISEGSLTNFTTELASKLGTFLDATIGISATYNQTTQEYDYSITITSNE